VLEVVVLIKSCLVHPNRQEMRLYLLAQTLKRRIVCQGVFRVFTINVGDCPQQEILVSGEYETTVQGGEGEHLFLPAAICVYRLSIINRTAGRLYLFKLIFVREELSKCDLLLTHWRVKDYVKLSDVINSESCFGFRCASDCCYVELKPQCSIELFPARNEFQHQMSLLQLPVVRAV